jgi:hypothetical protein
MSETDDLPESERVVVLSYGLWQQRYGADPGVLGTSIRLDARPHTIVGVMPQAFSFPPPITLEEPASPEPCELWVPFAMEMRGNNRAAHFMYVIGRLGPGISNERAGEEMQTIALRLQQEFPESNADWEITLVPLDSQVLGDVRTPLFLLLGAVGFVLLIACANTANLLLARGAVRRPEFATRVALGAGRGLLLRQLIIESLVLALIGGAVGLVIAFAGVEMILRLAPDYVPRIGETVIDLNVAAFTVAVSIVATQSGRSTRLRAALVVTEVALSIVLLTGAGLLIRSFAELRGLDTGFASDGVTTMSLSLLDDRYGEAAARIATFREIEEQVRARPGVISAGFVYDVPLSTDRNGTRFIFEEDPPTESYTSPGLPPDTSGRWVSRFSVGDTLTWVTPRNRNAS